MESGGDLLLLVLVLVFAGCEHVQGAVASLGVVPDLDVVVDRAGEFDACLPSSAVEQLDLHAGPERLDHRIVERGTNSTDRRREAGFCDLLTEDPGCELGGFNWWTQRFTFGGIVDARRAPRLACATRASCVAGC